VQVSSGERSADLQRQEGSSDSISSEHTLLANLFQGIRKEKKKRKKKRQKKKTPGSDSAVCISSHRSALYLFVLRFFFL